MDPGRPVWLRESDPGLSARSPPRPPSADSPDGAAADAVGAGRVRGRERVAHCPPPAAALSAPLQRSAADDARVARQPRRGAATSRRAGAALGPRACEGAPGFGPTSESAAPRWDALEEFKRASAHAASAPLRPAGRSASMPSAELAAAAAQCRCGSRSSRSSGADDPLGLLAAGFAAAACGAPPGCPGAGGEWRAQSRAAAEAASACAPPPGRPPRAPPPPSGCLRAPPLLPTGRVLTLSVSSTWGDPHYVGLTGLDIFTADGSLLAPSAAELATVRAEPAGVHALPGMGHDPRLPSNVFSGANCTADDARMWLAPFCAGQEHSVQITLHAPATLALVRVWNYNKSRTHSFRGARQLSLFLDGVPIFAGEVNKAPGNARDAPAAAEVILFTTDEQTLAAVEANDPVVQQAAQLAAIAAAPLAGAEPAERPGTAGGRARCGGCGGTAAEPPRTPPSAAEPLRPSAADVPAELLTAVRPQTNAGRRAPRAQPAPDTPPAGGAAGVAGGLRLGVRTALLEEVEDAPAEPRGAGGSAGYGGVCADGHGGGGAGMRADGGGSDYVLPRLPAGRCLELRLLSTWGDRHYVGLNGLEVWVQPEAEEPPLEEAGEEDEARGWEGGAARPPRRAAAGAADVGPRLLRLGAGAVSAEPSSINELPSIHDDPRTPDKLLDGVNATRDDGHMWLAPWTAGGAAVVRLALGPAPVRIAMVRLWNYGKTPCRGAKQFELLMDGEALLYAGYMRRAPERPGQRAEAEEEDWAQTLLFTDDRATVEREARHVYSTVEIAEETLFVDEGRQLSAQAANTAARPHTSAVGVGRAVPPPAGALSGAAELQPAPLPGTLAARALATAAGPEWARGAADVRTTGRQ